jgi:hypothetical protein
MTPAITRAIVAPCDPPIRLPKTINNPVKDANRIVVLNVFIKKGSFDECIVVI